MIRRISSVALALVVSLSAAAAGAQAPGGFGTSGQLAIGAERMFGFVSSSQKTERETPQGTQTTTASFSEFSLLGFHDANQFVHFSPYSHPRLGIDFFVIDNLSVGGSLAFMTRSTEVEQEGPVTGSVDGPSTTGFLFAPRAGYALMFNDVVGIWPRAGFTYYSLSTEQDTPVGAQERGNNGLAFTLEGLFVITPVRPVGFSVGPTLDLGLTGSANEQDPGFPEVEQDRTITDIGVQAGLFVWF